MLSRPRGYVCVVGGVELKRPVFLARLPLQNKRLSLKPRGLLGEMDLLDRGLRLRGHEGASGALFLLELP